ncbi:MAG: ferritin-like domain-containing protein [Myxococcota bacterium]
MATAPATNEIEPPGADLERILTSFDTAYAWNYGSVKEGLRELYEKAKREQWNATTALAWDTAVDPESEIIPQAFNPLENYGPYRKLDEKGKARFRHANISWTLSQFLHGEQGAMLTAAQLVDAVPWIDAKYYASTQTMDEARHVEVFDRYLREKLEWEWPINKNLKALLDLILTDSRWDMKYLGMQILVEGLAMAAFGNMYQMAQEPLIKDLVRYVMRDESRHVAFGVISLKGYYDDMPEVERRDREDFVLEACELMRDRLVGEDIAHAFGWSPDEVREVVLASPIMQQFRQLLFMRVVPNIKRLGLLTPRVRQGFSDLEIIQFEDADPEAMDHQLGLVG